MAAYNPLRTNRQDEFDQYVLALKSLNILAIENFVNVIMNPLKDCEFAVCAVPSHDAVSSHYSSGIRKLAKELGKIPGVTDLSGNLIRKYEIPKKSAGGKRDLHTDLQSLQLKSPSSFAGREVLLLDDVATTWTTMTACVQVIKEAEPKDVVPFALGRTWS